MLDQGNGQLSAVGFFNPLLGGGESVSVSGGAGAESLGGVFDISDGKIVRCALVFGRQWVRCDDTALSVLGAGKTPTGVIYAEVEHSSTELKLAVKHKADGNLPDNSLQKSYRALYYAYDAGISGSEADRGQWSWADVRFQPAMFAMN